MHNELVSIVKVVMCEKYTTGCDMGERCHYAHGHDELKYYRIKQVGPSVAGPVVGAGGYVMGRSGKSSSGRLIMKWMTRWKEI